MKQAKTICRSCNAFCPIEVTIDHARATKVTGNRAAPIYKGYTCPKGRSLPSVHSRRDRLKSSLKRQPDGSFVPISSQDLVGELSERIGVLIDRHGSRSIAAYLSGGVIEQPAASTLMISFLEAIGPPMLFSASTIDQPGMTIGYGWADPFAYCGPALVEPPADSDLLEAWQIYYRVAQRLELPLKITNWRSALKVAPELDMKQELSTSQIYDLMCTVSAIPIEEVRRHPDGHVFEAARKRVLPRDPACTDRLELANTDMLRQLEKVAREDPETRRGVDSEYAFLLVPGRLQNATNTFAKAPSILKWTYNPAFMHPLDLAEIGIGGGEEVLIRSRHGQVRAIAEQDDGLRRKVVSLMHGFGSSPSPDADPRIDGTNVNHLTSWQDDFEVHTGMPRMGALPNSVTPAGVKATET